MKKILDELTELVLEQAATEKLQDWSSFCQQHFKVPHNEEGIHDSHTLIDEKDVEPYCEQNHQAYKIEDVKEAVLAHFKKLEAEYATRVATYYELKKKYEALKLAYPYLEDAHLRYIKVNNKKREQQQLEERLQAYKEEQLDYLKDYESYLALTKDETPEQSGVRRKLVVYKNQPVYESIIDASLRIKAVYSQIDYEKHVEDIETYSKLVEELERLIYDNSVADELNRLEQLEEQLENHIDHILWEDEQLDILKEAATSELVLEEIMAEHEVLLEELDQIKVKLQQIYDRRTELLKEDKQAKILAVKNEAYELKEILECYKEEYIEMLQTYYEKEDITKEDIINLFKTVTYLKGVYGEYFEQLDYIPQHLVVEPKREAAKKYMMLEKECIQIEKALEETKYSLGERLDAYSSIKYHGIVKAYMAVEPSIETSLKNGITVEELKQMRQDLKDMQKALKEKINYDHLIEQLNQWREQIQIDEKGIEILTKYAANIIIATSMEAKDER